MIRSSLVNILCRQARSSARPTSLCHSRLLSIAALPRSGSAATFKATPTPIQRRWAHAVASTLGQPQTPDTTEKNIQFTKARPQLPKKVLIAGSGGLSIGQAGEFDYSGSQAIKALKEEGVHTVLVNPNIATIQTDQNLADSVYFLPVTLEYLTHIIKKERPDGLLLQFGGQTALNCGIALHDAGVLEQYNVKVLGTPVSTLVTSEDRHLFAKVLQEIDIPIAKSVAVSTVEDALAAAERIQYPVIIRSAFALGGLGSGFADNADELRHLANKSLSLSPQILVEKSMRGWKEIEYEVVRDAQDNCITVCNMENFDPLGVHTGDSIVVAPSQTLSDEEYHMLRTAAIKIVRRLGVVGEVLYCMHPCLIAGDSALASKATGYPLAFVAAKIALGYSLPELKNAVTKTTSACFEPSPDYVITKIPRWDLSKFAHVKRDIGSQMKSVGEVMAIGRTFEESLQKAMRQVDPSVEGFEMPSKMIESDGELADVLAKPTDRRLFHLAQAILTGSGSSHKYDINKLHDLTRIDKWFLSKLYNLRDTSDALKQHTLDSLPSDLLKEAKQQGFSDRQISKLLAKPGEASSTPTAVSQELEVRAKRKQLGIVPVVKRIDTLAAEFPADTNYLYMTYNGAKDDVTFDDKGTMVLGSGVYRIGSSVEFDWCGVSCIRSLRKLGEKTVMVNYNPETVSTDFDECDRLYFEELSMERTLDIYEKEQASGLVVSVGGQLPQNIALKLHNTGDINILGTHPERIDMAEDRFKFSKILDSIGVSQPEWKELTSIDEAKQFADTVQYPVLIRPSYVLSGAAMKVARTPEELETYLAAAADISPDHPVVVTKYIEGAQEIDIDAVAHNGQLLAHAVSEHIEPAGVHSGDASLIFPSRELSTSVQKRLQGIAAKIAQALHISGPFNMQIIKHKDELKVIECNLRASRSFPFVSKVMDVNLIDIATRAIVGKDVPQPLLESTGAKQYQCVKVPQFSWTRLAGADPMLGVEMSSTGEVACFGRDKHEAYLTALKATNGFRVPVSGVMLVVDRLTDGKQLAEIVKGLRELDLPVHLTLEGSQIAASKSLSSDKYLAHDLFADSTHSADEHRNSFKRLAKQHKVDFVINLAKERVADPHDQNYLIRRFAVDLGFPLIAESNGAQLLVEALIKQRKKNAQGASAMETPSEVKSWSEWLKV
ncbi:carbamoyl-phosphate synthase (glutamine-hydrolyzing) cpa2 [Sorochytrium milnesiophthora]